MPHIKTTGNKSTVIAAAIADLLIGSPERAFTVAQLHRELLGATVYDLDISEAHIRAALKLLPEGVVTRQGQRLIAQARGFANHHDSLPALRAAYDAQDNGLHLPVMVKAIAAQVCRVLVIPQSALIRVIEWAGLRDTALVLNHGWYGTTVTFRAMAQGQRS